jgi:ketosteroid isomerase-like protein
MKNWWVVFKINTEIHTHRYDEYMERNEEDGVYQEEIEEHENFTVSDGARLTELATCDVELMKEEQHPSRKRLQKNHKVLERNVFRNHNE